MLRYRLLKDLPTFDTRKILAALDGCYLLKTTEGMNMQLVTGTQWLN